MPLPLVHLVRRVQGPYGLAEWWGIELSPLPGCPLCGNRGSRSEPDGVRICIGRHGCGAYYQRLGDRLACVLRHSSAGKYPHYPQEETSHDRQRTAAR